MRFYPASNLLTKTPARYKKKKTKELKNRTLSNQNGGNPPSLPLTRQLQRWRGAVRVRSIDTSFEIDGELGGCYELLSGSCCIGGQCNKTGCNLAVPRIRNLKMDYPNLSLIYLKNWEFGKIFITHLYDLQRICLPNVTTAAAII